MNTLLKKGMVFIRVADPHFIFDRIGDRTIKTHIRRFIPSYLALALKQVLSFCTIPLLNPLLNGVHM